MTRPQKIIVVGGVAAGPSAAAKAKRTNPASEVAMYEAGSDVSYGVCEMPYLISGELSSPEDLTLFTPDTLAESKGISVHVRHQAMQIHPIRKTVQIKNLMTGGIEDVKYDKLILALGSKPATIEGVPRRRANVFTLSTLSETEKMLAFLENAKPASVCIGGGGYSGIEAAESFRCRKMKVTMLEAAPFPLPSMDPEARALIAEIIASHGIELKCNTRGGSAVDEHGSVIRLETTTGPVSADMYLIAAGIVPNTLLAKEAGIKLGPHGGIVTDQRQMTSIDSIYAAGDCTEVLNLPTRQTQLLPFATIASKTGRVAGENAAGGHAVFKGAVPVSAIQAFGYEIAQAGSAQRELADARIDAIHAYITAKTRVGFMPGAETILVSMTADRRTRRLLNANVIAREHAAQRINTVAMAVRQAMTIDEYLETDFVYTPRLAPLWDPMLLCAQQLQKQLK